MHTSNPGDLPAGCHSAMDGDVPLCEGCHGIHANLFLSVLRGPRFYPYD